MTDSPDMSKEVEGQEEGSAKPGKSLLGTMSKLGGSLGLGDYLSNSLKSVMSKAEGQKEAEGQGEIDSKAYQTHFSASAFWEKLKKFASKAGKDLVEKALQLFYVVQDPNTPMQAKGIAVGALGYFILPVDLIPDLVPVAGYTDDASAIAAALAALAAHITPEIKDKACQKLGEWFGQNEPTLLLLESQPTGAALTAPETKDQAAPESGLAGTATGAALTASDAKEKAQQKLKAWFGQKQSS